MHDNAETVLIVDDSELACESVKHALKTVGCAVVALNSPFGFIRSEEFDHMVMNKRAWLRSI